MFSSSFFLETLVSFFCENCGSLAILPCLPLSLAYCALPGGFVPDHKNGVRVRGIGCGCTGAWGMGHRCGALV